MDLEGSYNLSSVTSAKENREKGKKLKRPVWTGNDNATSTDLENDSGWDGGSQNSEAQIIRETRTITIESSAAGAHNAK